MRAGAPFAGAPFLSHQRININTVDSKKEGKEGKCALPPIFTLLLVCRTVGNQSSPAHPAVCLLYCSQSGFDS
jgi:hypothetical protein